MLDQPRHNESKCARRIWGVAFLLCDQSSDVVYANQVIEHVSDLGRFMYETNRVLRTGGALVISTEDASSWHNICAAMMGLVDERFIFGGWTW